MSRGRISTCVYRLGGLGIRRIVDHGPVAFVASHESARLQCKETWLPIDDVPDSLFASHQRAASALVDRVTLDRLIEKGSARDKQRLRRLDCEHANSWITALPSATDGKDTLLLPKIFITAVSRLLGLPVYSKPFPCPLCQQTMDILGDHALMLQEDSGSYYEAQQVAQLVVQDCRCRYVEPCNGEVGSIGSF